MKFFAWLADKQVMKAPEPTYGPTKIHVRRSWGVEGKVRRSYAFVHASHRGQALIGMLRPKMVQLFMDVRWPAEKARQMPALEFYLCFPHWLRFQEESSCLLGSWSDAIIIDGEAVKPALFHVLLRLGAEQRFSLEYRFLGRKKINYHSVIYTREGNVIMWPGSSVKVIAATDPLFRRNPALVEMIERLK
ncbi:MAG: hypothetical protein ABIA67_05640 [Candidatus Margulisiibacteriota bacterium]